MNFFIKIYYWTILAELTYRQIFHFAVFLFFNIYKKLFNNSSRKSKIDWPAYC